MDELGEILENEAPDDTVIRLTVGIGAWHTDKRSGLDELVQAAQEAAQNVPLVRQRAANLARLAMAARLMDRPQDAIRAAEMARSLLSLPKVTSLIEVSARVTAGLAAVATGEAQEAMDHYRWLKNLRGPGSGSGFPISADHLLGLLAHTAGMPAEATTHFEDALKFNGKAGYRLEEAWTCHDYAESLIDRGEPDDLEKATLLIDDGLEISRELGLVAIEKRLITLQEKAASMAAPAAAYPDGLTGREVEVLRLLAAGRTNQQIADDLVIAPSTAAKHVANILGKTGSSNRAEAATYANQQGLVKA